MRTSLLARAVYMRSSSHRTQLTSVVAVVGLESFLPGESGFYFKSDDSKAWTCWDIPVGGRKVNCARLHRDVPTSLALFSFSSQPQGQFFGSPGN